MELRKEELVARGMDERQAETLLAPARRCLAEKEAEPRWRRLTAEVLRPEHPFALHQFLHERAFADWSADRGPRPIWFPSPADVERAHVTRFMRALGLDSYAALHAWSVAHREAYWEKLLERLDIPLMEPCERLLDLEQGMERPRWLCGARLNIAESCLRGEADERAILFQREGGPLEQMSRGQLRALSARVANGLARQGLGPGSRIAVDMPMTAESVAIYLGIVRAGCAVVAIADSFSPREIATRLRIGQARAIFTQDFILRGGKKLPLYERVQAAGAPRAVVLPGGDKVEVPLRSGDLLWEEFLADEEDFASLPCTPETHSNILFSSGTTGDPKAIPWNHTTPLKCISDSHFHHDIHPGEVVAWPTNLGWMMGPWLIYASLANGATMALYYGAPTGRDFGLFVQEAAVEKLGVIPSLVRTWRASECMRGLDWSRVRAFSTTGECSNAEDMFYLSALAGYRPVIEYCGGTELAGGYLICTLVQPSAPAAFTTPTLGLDLEIADEQGRPCQSGEVFIAPPSIGFSTELLNGDHHEIYYAGAPERQGLPLRRHGDQVERLPGGYYRVHGRVDDTMNLGGIKVSSAEIERELNQVQGVRETAAIAAAPPGGGPSLLVVYAVVEQGTLEEGLRERLQAALRETLNPLFKVHAALVVETLPRTASNKVMRRVLRQDYAQREGSS